MDKSSCTSGHQARVTALSWAGSDAVASLVLRWRQQLFNQLPCVGGFKCLFSSCAAGNASCPHVQQLALFCLFFIVLFFFLVLSLGKLYTSWRWYTCFVVGFIWTGCSVKLVQNVGVMFLLGIGNRPCHVAILFTGLNMFSDLQLFSNVQRFIVFYHRFFFLKQMWIIE